jgi:hypothetical protein
LKRPRLRHKSEGEVKVPAYEMLRQDRGLGQNMLGALLRGVCPLRGNVGRIERRRKGWGPR